MFNTAFCVTAGPLYVRPELRCSSRGAALAACRDRRAELGASHDALELHPAHARRRARHKGVNHRRRLRDRQVGAEEQPRQAHQLGLGGQRREEAGEGGEAEPSVDPLFEVADQKIQSVRRRCADLL